MLLQSLWHWAVAELMQSSSTPHLDVELLLAMHLGLTRAQLYSQAACSVVSLPTKRAIKATVKHRKMGEPMAYLLGQQEFWSLRFLVNSSVLVPRPETELLVELVLKNYTTAAKKIADLGTGSGAIALALASERPAWHLIATDCCRDALRLAERNSHRHGLQNVELRWGDWCGAFQTGECFDAIISNPPYLAYQDLHFQSELGLRFEPEIALISGENGLNHIKVIIDQARHYLRAGGWLFLEHGYKQGEFVRQFFLKCGYQRLQQHKDLAGNPRVMSGKWH